MIGGGITGLVATRELLVNSDAIVLLLEESDRLGGKVFSEETSSGIVEWGPDAFLARDDTVPALCRDLGIDDRLMRPDIFGGYVFARNKLRRFPPAGPYGIPASPRAARQARLISTASMLRAYGDLIRPGRLSGPDVSVGAWVRRRFGQGVLANMVDPILAGTRAGSAETMSLAAATPQLDELARNSRSALRALKKVGPPGAPPFLGMSGGLQGLTDALADEVRDRASVRLNTSVKHIYRDAHTMMELDRGETVRIDGAILCVPAHAASEIVAPLSDRATSLLSSIEYASVAVATLAYEGSPAVPTDGSGVLIPSANAETMAALTWYSNKWPQHVADGTTLLRCFVGRTEGDPNLEKSDDDLLDAIEVDINRVMGWTSQASERRLHRWDRAMPQYAIGHLDRIDEAEKELKPFTIALAGAGYRGSGLPDCIRQATSAARRLCDVPLP